MAASGVTANKVGKAFRIDDAIGRYIVFLKNTFPQELTLEGLHIVVDCAHGATYKVAPTVFEELGAEGNPAGGETQRGKHQQKLRCPLSRPGQCHGPEKKGRSGDQF